MNGEIAAILAMDGIASGAIYVLIGLGLVLIFAVTRVIFVPFGDIAAFTALSLASLETGGRPGTVGLVAVLAVLATAVEATALVRNRALHRLPRALLLYLVLPLIPAAAVWFAAGTTLSMPLRIVLSLALVLPIAPLLDRIVLRPQGDLDDGREPDGARPPRRPPSLSGPLWPSGRRAGGTKGRPSACLVPRRGRQNPWANKRVR